VPSTAERRAVESPIEGAPSRAGATEVQPMPPQLVQPRDKHMLSRSAVDRRAVIEHLRLTLISFAMKGEYRKFYIGITRDVESRLYDHQRRKPDFKLMVPIYQEESIIMADSFDFLERDAIEAFHAGIRHPDTRQMLLECANGPGAATPKTTLYILLG
jgi:hypothetical protein